MRRDYQGRRLTPIPWIRIFLVFIVLLLVAGIVMSRKRWEGTPPVLHLNKDFKALGRNPAVTLLVQDTGSGLKQVTVTLTQKGQSIPLLTEEYPGPTLLRFWKSGEQQPRNFDLGKLIAAKLQGGSATLEISAVDNSLRNFFRGNRASLQQAFVYDTDPPTLEAISGQHYINQGGSECIVYRVSPDAVTSGVQVGSHLFRGYPVEGGEKGEMFALFAFAYNVDAKTIPKLVATDEAGNQAVTGFTYKLFPKTFRSSIINLNDQFLQKVVPEVLSHTTDVRDQGDLLKTFLVINSKLRAINHAMIYEISQKTAHKFLWNGAFLQLSNSQVESLFADRRTYVYEEKVVDHQDHVGFDLSAVQHYPIEAANDGVVLYASYLGIYGNCVLIDHGYGLITLYGHLSSIDVKPGQSVKKKQVLGKSGETGLAGGDHLHFGMFLDGVPVNPTEWWDDHWIQDHIAIRFKKP